MQQPQPLLPPRRFAAQEVLWIGLALMIGASLRLVANNQPFASSDHAELAAIVSFFYPRNLAALSPSNTSTWQLLTNVHGTLPPLIGLIGTTLLALSGVQITEFWWNFPFVLIQLLTIPLAAMLIKQLAGRRAGILAAILVAVLPIHAALSRASGLSHIPLTFACQLLTIWRFVRYYNDPTPRRARWAGLALTLNLLVELLFPVLFVLVFGVGLLTVQTRKPLLGLRLHRARMLMFNTRTMLLPLLVVCFNFVLLIGYINGWFSGGGIATRLLEGSDRKAGLYLRDFWANSSYVVGGIALVLLGGLGVAGVPALWRREARAVPLLWAIVYLAPFLLFTRPRVYEYLLLGVAPLTLNAAIIIDGWWQTQRTKRWAAATILGVLVALFTLRAMSMIFGLNLVPLAGTGQAPGGIFPDQGLKAAAWWVRSYMPSASLVFADSAYEPYQIAYYTQRPFLAVTDAEDDEAAYRLLDTATQPPDVYFVKPGNEALLARHTPTMPRLAATILVAQQPALLIYTSGAAGALPAAPQQITAALANRQFDAQFGSWRTMFAIGQ